MRFFACLLASLPLVVGCNAKDGKKDGGTKSNTPKKPIDAATAGTIEGAVLFEGTPAPPRKIEMTLPECRAVHPEPVDFYEVSVKDGKLKNSFVYVKQGLEDYEVAAPSGEVVIDQKGCMYEPYVTGVQVDQKLVLLNSDAFNHNVNARPENNTAFNVAMPRKGMRIDRVLDEPEVMIKMKCDIHPWMLAWIGVVAHPHFKVTGEDGAFTFKGLPPGDYVIEAWHQVGGKQEQKVKLAPKETKSVQLTFKG
jgi:hypothetical protein